MKWKISGLMPRLKRSEMDRYVTSLYWPVAVLPTISKLLERVAQQQLLKFFDMIGQFNTSCHTYHKNLSMMTTLMDILDNIYQGAEENKFTSMMTVVQYAAFDCLDRKLLLEKLHKYNLSNQALGWIEEYLSDITQFVTTRRYSGLQPPTSSSCGGLVAFSLLEGPLGPL